MSKSQFLRPLMFVASVSVFLGLTLPAYASMTIRYYNEDSTSYSVDTVCSGSHLSPTVFDASKTSSVSLQGSTPCKLTLNGTSYEFKGDQKIRIKNGKISFE